MRLLIAAISLATVSAGCGAAMSVSTTRAGARAAGIGYLPREAFCQDGLPVRILTDPICANGICGYSCLPDRWRGDWPERTPR